MEPRCDADGDVMQSTLTFAQQSQSTLMKALQELILLHERELAKVQTQLQAVPPKMCEGDSVSSEEKRAAVSSTSSGTPQRCAIPRISKQSFPRASFSPMSQMDGDQVPSDEKHPREFQESYDDPCDSFQQKDFRSASDSSSPTRRAVSFPVADEEIGGGASLPSSAVASPKGVTFLLPEKLSEKQRGEEDVEQASCPSRTVKSQKKRISLGNNRVSLSTYLSVSRSIENSMQSRAFRSVAGNRLAAAVVSASRMVFRSAAFEFLFCGLVLLDCALLGMAVETVLSNGAPERMDAIYGVECLLAGLFLLELLGRCAFFQMDLDGSWESLAKSKVQLTEIGVTLLSVLVAWILVPSGVSHYSSSIAGKGMQLLSCTRFFRFARFYRLGRHCWLFRDVFVFLRGISGSFVTFLWAILLLGGITFAFGIIGVVTISSPIKELLQSASDPDEVALLQHMVEHFVGTLPLMMYTLSKILTGQITCTTFLTDIDKFLGSSWIFWQVYLAITQVLLMNLTTATLVDNAIGYQQAEAQKQREVEEAELSKRRLAELRDLFQIMDENGDDTLSWAEIKQGLHDEEIKSRWKQLDIKPEEAKACFHMLDTNGVGEVGIEAFFEGLQRMRGVAQSADLLKTFTVLYDVQRTLRTIKLGLLRPADDDGEGRLVSQMESCM